MLKFAPRKFLATWQGLALASAALVPTLWLAATGQLILYIHPRYVVFTAIMAAIGLLFVIAGVISRFRGDGDHDHGDHGDHGGPSPVSRLGRAAGSVAAVLALVVAFGLVLVPPATLTTATADQRVINSTSVGSSAGSAASGPTAGGGVAVPAGASSHFTVLDWSALLRQTTDPNFYRNKAVDVTGFVTADTSAPADLFYVSRFVITCCAVDAQPVGVPVYLPGWKTHFSQNEWVQVTGAFATDPSTTSTQSIALAPSTTKKVGQPRDPYLY